MSHKNSRRGGYTAALSLTCISNGADVSWVQTCKTAEERRQLLLEKKVLHPREFIAKRLGYEFKDLSLLYNALSCSLKSSGNYQPFQKLEFLGDRVVNLFIAHNLRQTRPRCSLGQLSKRFDHFVSNGYLGEFARSVLKLEEHVNCKVELDTHGFADLFEAIMGAIFEDSDMDFGVVAKILTPLVEKFDEQTGRRRIFSTKSVAPLSAPIQALSKPLKPADEKVIFAEKLLEAVAKFEEPVEEVPSTLSAAPVVRARDPKDIVAEIIHGKTGRWPRWRKRKVKRSHGEVVVDILILRDAKECRLGSGQGKCPAAAKQDAAKRLLQRWRSGRLAPVLSHVKLSRRASMG